MRRTCLLSRPLVEILLVDAVDLPKMPVGDPAQQVVEPVAGGEAILTQQPRQALSPANARSMRPIRAMPVMKAVTGVIGLATGRKWAVLAEPLGEPGLAEVLQDDRGKPSEFGHLCNYWRQHRGLGVGGS